MSDMKGYIEGKEWIDEVKVLDEPKDTADVKGIYTSGSINKVLLEEGSIDILIDELKVALSDTILEADKPLVIEEIKCDMFKESNSVTLNLYAITN